MKRLLSLAVSLLVLTFGSPALALDDASIPLKFAIPWGNSAGSAYIRSIPQTSQIGIQNCAASLTDGFPPLTFTPSSAGGCPPFGQDFNGILKQITQWSQWQQAGGPLFFDSGFSASIGGYPKGSSLTSTASPTCVWVSTVDSNTNNPDSGGANWLARCSSSPTATGTANAQIISTPFSLIAGSELWFFPVASNTAALQINVNGTGLTTVKKQTSIGLLDLCGGEVNPTQLSRAVYDGTVFQLVNPIVKPSTYQYLTGGPTYTPTSTCVTNLMVDIGGGGGGGGGNGASSTGTAGTGGTTSFGSTTALGGGGGANTSTVFSALGGSGGSGGSTGTGVVIRRLPGGTGSNGSNSNASISGLNAGGTGCIGPLGGGAATGIFNVAGVAAVSNTGSGGSGAGLNPNTYGTAGGGGCGETVTFRVPGPLSASYAVTVGAAGAQGAGSSGGSLSGGSAATGYVLVQENYQ